MFSQQCRRVGLVAGLASSLLVPTLLHAQTRGTIKGRVTDTQGGYLPGVEVTAKLAPTSTVWRTVTDGVTGSYVLANLPAGRYAVRMELTAFKPREIDVSLEAGANLQVDATLELGTIDEAPIVLDGDEPPLVETTHAALGLLIPNRDLIELPLNGRNFTQLGTLMPGVLAPPAALGGQAGDATPGGFGNVTEGAARRAADRSLQPVRSGSARQPG